MLGATVSQGASAVVLDVAHDPRTDGLRDVAARCGVGGVWTTPIFDSDGSGVLGAVVTFLDDAREPTAGEREVVQMFAQTAAIAIERQAAEELLAHRANHDLLTGLPNRGLFLDFLGNALARAERDDAGIAVLFLDVDRFKHVNDGMGHDAGDVLLRELAHRLKETVRPSDVVARFGGDEFTVLCAGLDPQRAEEQASELARRLLTAIERPLQLDGEDRRLSASVGVAMAGAGSTPEGLLRDADAAMYEAKQRGKARFEVFDDEMRSSLHARLDLEARLERAIEAQEFRLVVQPIVDLATGRCVAAEALLRWQDPDFGLVTPDAFIGLAEDTGLIIPIGEWALAEACRTVAGWEEIGLLAPEFTMAVNLSARQVGQADLVERVRAVIADSGPTASRLCLEITESVLMEESSVAAMYALKALGVRLSIDDFGTGYSSLGYLKKFPVDSVKVDRSFVDGLGIEGEDSAIVAAVVSLGHALGLSVVAEGVETSGQLHALLGLGCDRAQGYWFSGPRTPPDFAALLHAQPWVHDDRRPHRLIAFAHFARSAERGRARPVHRPASSQALVTGRREADGDDQCRGYGVGDRGDRARDVHDAGARPVLRRHGPHEERARDAHAELLLARARERALGGGRLLARVRRDRQVHRQLRLPRHAGRRDRRPAGLRGRCTSRRSRSAATS